MLTCAVIAAKAGPDPLPEKFPARVPAEEFSQEALDYAASTREARVALLEAAEPAERLEYYLARVESQTPILRDEDVLLLTYEYSLVPAITTVLESPSTARWKVEDMFRLLGTIARDGSYDCIYDARLMRAVIAAADRGFRLDPTWTATRILYPGFLYSAAKRVVDRHFEHPGEP